MKNNRNFDTQFAKLSELCVFVSALGRNYGENIAKKQHFVSETGSFLSGVGIYKKNMFSCPKIKGFLWM